MKKIKYIFAAILAMFFWSSSFAWVKIAFEYYNPLTIIVLRLLLAALFTKLLLFVLKKDEKIKKEHRKTILLMAFFEPFCYFLGETFGMQYVSATLGAIIVSTIPLITPIFSKIFLKETMTKFGVFGLLISFIGVMLIVTNDFSGSNSILGIGLMLFAVMSGIGYGVLLKKMSLNYSSIILVNKQSFYGFLYFLPLFFIFDFKKFVTINPDIRIIFIISALSLFGSVLAFIFFTIATRNIGLNNANLFVNLIPVFAAIVSYFLINEKFTTQKIYGIIIVVAGLFVSQINYRKRMLFSDYAVGD